MKIISDLLRIIELGILKIQKGVMILKTKFYRRVLSVFLSVLMLMSMLTAAAVEASAANSTVVSITLDEVKRRYQDASKFLDLCNEYRSDNKLVSWIMDSELMEAAMVKAAGLAVYVDELDLDGSSFLDNTSEKRGIIVGYDVGINSGLIDIFRQDSVYNDNFNSTKFKSVGIGVVEVMKIKYICIMLSDKTPTKVSDSVLNQANQTISQTLKCKTQYLTDMRMTIQDNDQVACGVDINLRMIVRNQFYSDAYAYISGKCADITSSAPEVIKANTDGTITGLKPGNATITMTLKGASNISTSAFIYAVAENFDDCTIGQIPDQIYTGNALTPTVSIVNEDGKTLVSGTDYTLSYLNNINPGTATVKITGKGRYAGSTASTTFVIKGSTNVFSVSLKTNKSVMETGQTATLSATVTNGTSPVKYKFEITPYGGSTFSVLQAESTASTCTYTPSNSGKYTIRVTAKDNAGKTATSNLNIEVSPKLSVTLSLSSSSVTLGSSITFTATPAGGTSPYNYRFSISEPSSTGYKVIKEYSTSNTCSYTPKSAGTYQVKVECKGGNNIEANTSAGFKVNASALVNSSSVSANNVPIGTAIKANGNASGGISPYTYAYYYKTTSETSWTTVSGYSSNTSVSITLPKVTTYMVKISVKDSAGTTADQTHNVMVYNPTPLTNNSTVSASTVKAGDTVTITGKAVGGTLPFKYAYYYKKSTDTAWKTIGTEFGTATTASFKAAPDATFNVKVIVKDGEASTAEKTFNVTATTTLANSSTLSASAINCGQKITITGKASGGTSPYKYAYYYKRTENSSWKTLGTEYGTDTTAGFTPTAAGSFDVKVNVKDNVGSVITKKLSFTVNNTLVNKSTVSASVIDLDKSVTLTGKAEGGTKPYKYAYYYKKSENSAWKTLGTEFGTAETAVFKPAATGKYDIRIKVKDNTGTVITKSLTLTVNDRLVNSSTSSASQIALGKSVTLTAKASGGTSPYKYAYYYKAAENSTWKVLGTEYGTAATASFKPTVNGVYNLRVKVRDGGGEIKTRAFKLIVSDLANKSGLNYSRVGIGTYVTLNGKAEAGRTPYTYAYYFKRSSNSTWNKIGTEYGTDTSAEFKPTAAAVYDIKISVKDANGYVASKTLTVTATDLANASVLNSDKVGAGSPVEISGKATGGSGGYKYAFSFKRAANTSYSTLGTAFGDETTATVTPTAQAEYNIRSIVKDSSGTVSVKTFTVSVCDLANKSTINYTKVGINNTVKVTGNASGGKAGYKYAFYFKRSSNTKWNTIGTAYGTDTSASFTPTAAADYDIKIIVKDANSAIASKTYKVTATNLANNSTISASSVKVNNSITLTGKASGGKSGYKYAFYYKRAENSTYKVIGTAFGTATTATFKPTAAASYNIKIVVKDANETVAIKTFTVKAA